MSPAKFTDVSERAGIRFTHHSGAKGQFHLPETMGPGCAFIDLDNDGWLDLCFINSRDVPSSSSQHGSGQQPPTIVLFRNNRDGTFTDVTKQSGLTESIYAMGCAVADFDNDGFDDLWVTTCLQGHRLYRNDGTGVFTDVTPNEFRRDPRFSTSAAWLDYDRDGLLDVFVCNYVRYRWTDDATCNQAEGYRAYCNPRYFPPQPCSLYHNEGNGRFTDVTTSAGIAQATGKALGVCVLDYDDDGWSDIVVASDTTRNLLFHNLRNGRFEEVAVRNGVAFTEDGRTRAGMGIDAADPARDGRLAILISNFSAEGLSLFQQDAPRRSFTDVSHTSGVWEPSYNFLGFGLFFFDFDNDGFDDAFVANGHVQPKVHDDTPRTTYAQRNLLFRNSGSGKFVEVSPSAGQPFTVERVSRGAAYGDFDNDGSLDILVGNNNQPAELLRNEGARGNNWIQFLLRGTKSNRNAIGAKVQLAAGGRKQTRWVRSGSSYLSQSMLRLHFGLGSTSGIEQLEVSWPSGLRESFNAKSLPAARLHQLDEGSGRVLP